MPKYQASLTDVNIVMENPEIYIIPECLEACKILWNKGIDTTQCSNYENNTYWIEINPSCLSENNRKYCYERANNKNDQYFGISYMTHNPCIIVPKVANAKEILCELANSFELQDTVNYLNADEYLDGYKRTDGQYIVLPGGNVQRNYNPLYLNATIEEAIKTRGDEDLYIKEEGRIYKNQHALNVHRNYLKQKDNCKNINM